MELAGPRRGIAWSRHIFVMSNGLPSLSSSQAQLLGIVSRLLPATSLSMLPNPAPESKPPSLFHMDSHPSLLPGNSTFQQPGRVTPLLGHIRGLPGPGDEGGTYPALGNARTAPTSSTTNYFPLPLGLITVATTPDFSKLLFQLLGLQGARFQLLCNSNCYSFVIVLG